MQGESLLQPYLWQPFAGGFPRRDGATLFFYSVKNLAAGKWVCTKIKFF
jgi:hypothetical protein